MALANQLYYLQEFNFRNCELLGTLKTSVTFFGYKQAKMSLNNTFLNAQPDNKFCLKKKIGRARVRTSVWVPDHAKPYQKKNEKQKKNTVKSQAVTSVEQQYHTFTVWVSIVSRIGRLRDGQAGPLTL